MTPKAADYIISGAVRVVISTALIIIHMITFVIIHVKIIKIILRPYK